jgi:hypothetical protein
MYHAYLVSKGTGQKGVPWEYLENFTKVSVAGSVLVCKDLEACIDAQALAFQVGQAHTDL